MTSPTYNRHLETYTPADPAERSEVDETTYADVGERLDAIDEKIGDPWIPDSTGNTFQFDIERTADGPTSVFKNVPEWVSGEDIDNISLGRGLYCLQEIAIARNFIWDNDTTSEGVARFKWYDSTGNQTVLAIPGGDGAPGSEIFYIETNPWMFYVSGYWGLFIGLNSGWTVFDYSLNVSFSLVRLMAPTSLVIIGES